MKLALCRGCAYYAPKLKNHCLIFRPKPENCRNLTDYDTAEKRERDITEYAIYKGETPKPRYLKAINQNRERTLTGCRGCYYNKAQKRGAPCEIFTEIPKGTCSAYATLETARSRQAEIDAYALWHGGKPSGNLPRMRIMEAAGQMEQ